MRYIVHTWKNKDALQVVELPQYCDAVLLDLLAEMYSAQAWNMAMWWFRQTHSVEGVGTAT